MRALLAFVAVASACTGVSPEVKKAADGHREVALAFVHEAEKAATDNQTLADEKYREALKELLDAEKTGAMDSDGRYLLGFVYFVGFKRYTEAESNIDAAIKLRQIERQEEYPEAENLMGNVLLDAGHTNEALAHFERARTNLLYATPYFAEQGMGQALFKLGRHDEAVQHFERALVAQPDLCGAYLKLAEVEIVKGDDAKVQSVLGDFLTRCDSERLRSSTGPRLLAPALLELGKSFLRTNAKDRALDSFRQCVQRFPGEPAARECDQQLRVLDAGAQ